MKIILFILAILTTGLIFAQTPPQAINYQAVARDASGSTMVSVAVSLIFDVRIGSSSGTIVYRETQTKTTNQYGLFTAEIGNGIAILGVFSTINWSSGLYYLGVTVNGDVMTATQLLSVPYAFHAGTATTVGNPTSLWSNNAGAIYPTTLTDSVGIGTNNPAELLHLKSADADIDIETNDDLQSSSFHLKRSGGSPAMPAIMPANHYFGNISFQGYDGNDYETGSRIEGSLDGTPASNDMPGKLSFHTRPAGVGTAEIERMRIDKDGKVGIGTTSPSEKLEVVGNIEIPETKEYKYAAPKTLYWGVAPSSFNSPVGNYGMGRVVSNDGTSYAYFVGGSTTSKGYGTAAVNLPDGATIISLTSYLYLNDLSVTNTPTVRLVRKGYLSSNVDIMAETPTTSTSTVPVTITDNTIVNAIVSNQSYIYSVVFTADENSPLQRVYGVRITYTVTKVD